LPLGIAVTGDVGLRCVSVDHPRPRTPLAGCTRLGSMPGQFRRRWAGV
jgi:hypothetical protein